MNRKIFTVCKSLLVSLWILFCFAALSNGECPEPPVTGRQPFPEEIALVFERAAGNKLGDNGPPYPSLIFKGFPPEPIPPFPAMVPPTLLKAVGYTESNWKQFDADYGKSGIVISQDCGYGIMQITSGMEDKEGFEPKKVISDYVIR